MYAIRFIRCSMWCAGCCRPAWDSRHSRTKIIPPLSPPMSMLMFSCGRQACKSTLNAGGGGAIECKCKSTLNAGGGGATESKRKSTLNAGGGEAIGCQTTLNAGAGGPLNAGWARRVGASPGSKSVAGARGQAPTAKH